MNYVVLNNNSTFAYQVTSANTIYEIRHEFSLGSTTVTIPNNCVLRFCGGILKNGCISSNNCKIESPLVKIFNNVTFAGNFLNGTTFEIEWFVDMYETYFNASSNKDAAPELNAAFSSGIKKVHFNNDRYFPVRSTIEVNGNLDISGETRYLDNSSWYLKQPCIYSNNVVNIFTYNFDSDHYSNEPKKTRLNIDGIHIYCAVGYDNILPANHSSSTYESQVESIIANVNTTSIVKINNVGSETLWGLHVNINITSIFEGGASTRVPNYTGLEIYAQNGNISFIEIWGYISQVFKGYKIHSASNKWVTDTKIFGNTMCALGGELYGGEPVRNYGTHQAISTFPSERNDAYFKALKFKNYGYVWDLNTKYSGNNLWSCRYVAKPISNGFTYDGNQETYSPISIVKPDDLFYPNLLADTYKYKNTGGIVVETLIRCFNSNGAEITYPSQTVEEHLAFKRYLFPEHLIRTDRMNWNSSEHSNIGYSTQGDSSLTYKYKTVITINDSKMLMAYQDNPPLYMSPILTHTPFQLKVTYYRKESNVWVETGKTFTFQFNPSSQENNIGTSYYQGRYYRIQDLFDNNDVAQNCKTVIEYEQDVTENSLINRPVFFIPNYHADKIVRAGANSDMPNMTSQDVGEMFYHTSNGQLWWNGTKWVERDGASAGVKRSGTFSQKPSGSLVYVGFRYFCTSGATVQGVSMSNIEIFYTGTGWVDALGRAVS